MKDFQSNQGVLLSASKIGGVAKQVVAKYTHAMFQEFEEELCESLSIAITQDGNDGIFYTYKLPKEKGKEFIVNHRAYCIVDYTCKKFESVGILCLHALKVLNFHNIFVLPAHYILKDGQKAPNMV